MTSVGDYLAQHLPQIPVQLQEGVDDLPREEVDLAGRQADEVLPIHLTPYVSLNAWADDLAVAKTASFAPHPLL